jgi:hypothetical protein
LPYFKGLQIWPGGHSSAAKTVEAEIKRKFPVKKIWLSILFILIFYQK